MRWLKSKECLEHLVIGKQGLVAVPFSFLCIAGLISRVLVPRTTLELGSPPSLYTPSHWTSSPADRLVTGASRISP